jgi:sec-independent protein translocase protein TatC
MPFTGHLQELRNRLIKSLLAVVVGFAVCYFFSDRIFIFILNPLKSIGSQELRVIGTGVTEAFFTKLKVALMGGAFVASPLILYQAWAFVAPGLYQKEKRYAMPFLFVGTLFFLLGAWFCYRIVFVYGYGFLLGQFEAIGIRPQLRVSEYLTLSAKLLLIFGALFELPVLFFFLTRAGIVDHKMLLKQFRYAVLGVFVIAAVLTPPDIISQVFVAGPLLLLYLTGILISYLFRRREPGGLSFG